MFRTEFSNFSIPLAFLASLGLHLVGLAVADRVRESQRIGLTESLPDPAPQNDTSGEPDEAKEEEITPGIQDGAAATMTWIGYDEYRRHIARLAETEQAAFTSAEARGVPDGERIVELEAKPLELDGDRTSAHAQEQRPQQDSPPPSGLDTSAAETANASGNELASDAAPAVVEPMAATEPTKDATVIAEASEDNGKLAPGQAATDHEAAKAREAAAAQARRLMNEALAQVERLIAEAVASAEEEAEPNADVALESRRDAARPQGEPAAPDAAPSEKDSEATSVIDAPKDAWTSGRPLAVEGLEVRPYNLFRHIVVDSNDRMFLHDISGVIERNPVVSLRFDRRGVAGEVRVLRASGYAPFDRLYLTTWMARWTANGEQLKSLSGDELSPPIVFKLVFVKEAKEERAEDDNQ